jgi:hypothetical protein
MSAAASIALLLASLTPAAPQYFDGQLVWPDQNSAPVFNEAAKCGLDVEQLTVTEDLYRQLPGSDLEQAELDKRVAEVAEKAGFSKDAAGSQISREFIRNLLTSRVLMRLSYDGGGDEAGMPCVIDWLKSQGFSSISATEADAIRAARND